MTAQQRIRIVNALTDYDRRASKRKGYNPYALGHYCAALGNVDAEIADGVPLRDSLIANFVGRLLDVVLDAAGIEPATIAEHRSSR